MAKKSYKEVVGLSKDELSSKIRSSEAELFKVRMQHQTGQLKDTSMMTRMRKTIAQMKTRHTQILGGK